MPGSYNSTPVHGKPGNEHVDIQYWDDQGKEVVQKEHIPVSFWSWGKGGDKEPNIPGR